MAMNAIASPNQVPPFYLRAGKKRQHGRAECPANFSFKAVGVFLASNRPDPLGVSPRHRCELAVVSLTALL